MRDQLPILLENRSLYQELEGQPMTATIFWHKPDYEPFLEMRAFADAGRKLR